MKKGTYRNRKVFIHRLERLALVEVEDELQREAIQSLAEMARGDWPKYEGRGKPKGSKASYTERKKKEQRLHDEKLEEEKVYAAKRLQYQERTRTEPKKRVTERLLEEAQSELKAKNIKRSTTTIRRKARLAGNKRPAKART